MAAANMGYYWTLVDDLPNEEIVVRTPTSAVDTSAVEKSAVEVSAVKNGQPATFDVDAVKKEK